MDALLEMADPDVVVVGAGLAGLAAARHLRRRGAHVVVLDGHSPGGRARSDQRDGFTFNRGPHALYLGGPGARVLAALGVRWTGGPPSSAAFGRRGQLIARLPSSARSLLTSRFVGFSGKVALGRALAGIGKVRPPELGCVSAREWIDGLGLPPDATELIETVVRVASYSNDFDDLSAQVAVGQVRLALDRGVRYLDGGWQVLVDALAEGCAIRRAQTVAVRSEGDGCVVITADDRRISCQGVIVAVGTPGATAAVLGRPPYDVAPSIEAACLDLGVRRPPRHPVLLGIDQPLYLSNNSVAARVAPDGTAVVHVARYLTAGDHASPEQQRAELHAHAAAAGVEPDDVVAERYLHRMTVVGALPSARHGGLVGRPRVEDSGVRGVSIAGDWVGPEGHLADASLASAMAAAELVLPRLAARR